MKITIQEVLNSLQALNQLGEEKLPARLSFTISLVISRLQVPGRIFQKERQKIVVRYEELLEKDQSELPPKDAAAFAEEVRILVDTEFELDGIGHIPISVFDEVGRCPKCNEKKPLALKPNLLAPLFWLFTEE